MSNRCLLAILAMVVAFGCQTAYAQPRKDCSQLMREVMTEHAKGGFAPVGATYDKDTGVQFTAYMKVVTSDSGYLEWLMPSGQPPPSNECPTTPPSKDSPTTAGLTLIDECMGSPTGEQVPYKYWRCTIR